MILEKLEERFSNYKLDESHVINRGAEAVIYDLGDCVLKKRVSKDYRVKELDDQINRTRTNREAKIIQKLNSLNVNSPMFKGATRNYEIFMTKVVGKTVKEKLIESLSEQDGLLSNIKIIKDVAKIVKTMHINDIVHGDLTTLNFIIKDNNDVYVLDFGLSFNSTKSEDKATDLYLFEKGLVCVHSEDLLKLFYEEYFKENPFELSIISKLEEIRKRGRKRE
ncbi:BUD32 [Hepatospora eriocheir]|uniref:non-specific serine/threonine protein kinase n=1 Tax=Hepatospora eriocheir TaxID=1081669 RepID=A0A1X0QDC0_9MICR|nr:BUD32 [Hepatospora eriocheir]